MEIKNIQTTKQGLNECRVLLEEVFKKNWSHENLRWLYVDNPDGKVVGFNAYDSNKIIGHYATIPINVYIQGKEEMGLLSLNTATHPDYSGKGIFTILAKKTYEFAKEQGFSFVVGVANASSIHVFRAKLGFQIVSQLRAMIGVGQIPEQQEKQVFYFQPVRSLEKKQWRYNKPVSNYFSENKDVYSPTKIRGVKAYLGPQLKREVQNEPNASRLNLWIGIDESRQWHRVIYFNIPNWLRPSPLNFIFKDLIGKGRTLDPARVEFTNFDFDAY